MTKSKLVGEELDRIISLAASGFQDYADTVEKYRQVRDEAKQAILALFKSIMPEAIVWGYGDFPNEDEMSESEGWNSYRTKLLKRLEEV